MENCELKTLLPVKNKDGRWVYPSQIVPVEVEDQNNEVSKHSGSENEESDEAENSDEEKTQVYIPKNFVENYALEQSRIKRLKTQIAIMCNSITSEPEDHMRLLKQLILMLKKSRTKMFVTEKKLLAFSLLRVFLDILPTYKIRAEEETELNVKSKKVKFKKETKRLLTYETTLVRYYKKYLDYLQKLINNMKCKKRKTVITPAKRKAFNEVGLAAAKCLAELLSSRYYFNYYKTIISILVPLACSRHQEIREVCCRGIENLYKADKLGETSLEAAKQTVKVIKERKFNVPSELIRTFLPLKLEEVKIEEEKTDMKKIRKELSMMSRKEKRYRKKMQDLENQLREAEAQENQKTKAKFQTEILKKMFWIYFHILKDDSKKSLVTAALEGLSKFAHLINLDFFDDLSLVLTSLMEGGTLSNIEKLHCMHTVFTILSGRAQSLKVDPQKMYAHLYNVLMDLQDSTNMDELTIALQCVELMVIKCRKHVTFNRKLAFIKRLCTVCINSPLHFTIAALLIVRSMMLSSSNCDILLDLESSIGSGVYLPELEDPEYCNPGSTSLWDLCILTKHYNPVVRHLAEHILRGCPFQGRMQLSDKLAKHPPEEILKQFGKFVVEHQIEPEQCKNPAKKLCIRKSADDIKYIKDINSTLSWNDVINIDFSDHVTSQKYSDSY